MRLAILLLSCAGVFATPFQPCCAYGGSGSVLSFGAGVLNAFSPPRGGPGSNPTGPSYAAPMALGLSSTRSFVTILFAAETGPEDSRAGWIVTSNATNDIIYVFANISSSGPACQAGVSPRGEMVGVYKACSGPGGLFDKYESDYLLTPSTRVGVFQTTVQEGYPATTMAFADERACSLTSLIGSSSPFGTGAFSLSFQAGSSAEPPEAWSAPPSWCNGKWVDLKH